MGKLLFRAALLRTTRARFRARGSPVTYAAFVTGWAWMTSWQAAQTTRVLRRLVAMSAAHAGWPGPAVPGWRACGPGAPAPCPVRRTAHTAGSGAGGSAPCGGGGPVGGHGRAGPRPCRARRGIPPNRATRSGLPLRWILASKQVRSPYRVSILALCLAAIFDTVDWCLAGRVGCTARSRIPCGCGPFLCSLPPNPACTFQRTGLSSDLCRVRDRVCVDPVISCRARGERQVPLRLLHCASLMVPSSFIACAPSPCGPSLAVSRLGGRYPAD